MLIGSAPNIIVGAEPNISGIILSSPDGNISLNINSGKSETYINKANEKIITAEKDNHLLDIYFRVYIVNGYKDGSFRPKNSITGAEAAAIVERSH